MNFPGFRRRSTWRFSSRTRSKPRPCSELFPISEEFTLHRTGNGKYIGEPLKKRTRAGRVEAGTPDSHFRRSVCGKPESWGEYIMFERYTEKARRVIFFARYEASQFWLALYRDRALAPRPVARGQGVDQRFLRSHASVESIRKQIEAHTTIREKVSTSVDLPLSNECKRVLATRRKKPNAWGTSISAPNTSFWDCCAKKMLRLGDFAGARPEVGADSRGVGPRHAGKNPQQPRQRESSLLASSAAT